MAYTSVASSRAEAEDGSSSGGEIICYEEDELEPSNEMDAMNQPSRVP
jgi:hypothetical protein